MGLYYNNPMLNLEIPGRGEIHLEHLVTDVNGTIAVDGKLIVGVVEYFKRIGKFLNIHMITANTHGQQKFIDEEMELQAIILNQGNETQQKTQYVNELGSDKVIAFGQGSNDSGMLKEAEIGVSVLSAEGLSLEAFLNSDLVVPDILSGLALLENPNRILASLRK